MIRIMLAVAALLTASTAAAAQTIPITVRWQKVEPDTVAIVTPDGTRQLSKDRDRKLFTGRIALPDTLVATRTLLLGYDNKSFPLYLNVRKAAQEIEFLADRDDVPSCAILYVERVEAVADNMEDAMRRMLTAAYMLSLPPPDRECQGPRKKRSAKARLDRNQNLATTSAGLFRISDDARQDVLRLPPADLRGSQSARQMVSNAEAAANSALAKSLYDDMKDLGAAEDYGGAKIMGEELTAAATADSGLAEGLKDQNVLGRLTKDTAYYATMESAASPQ